MKETFILKISYKRIFDDLSDKQAGTLIKVVFDYIANGDLPTHLSDLEIKMAFKFIQLDLDVFSERYQSISEKRAEAGRMGGAKTQAKNNNNSVETNNLAMQAKQAIANFDKQNKQLLYTDKDTDKDTDILFSSKENNIDIGSIKINPNWDKDVVCQCETKTGETCKRRSAYSINGINHCNQHSKGKIPEVVIEKTWRNDFEIYKQELRAAFLKLISDKEFISQRQKYYPKVDIRLTMEKACLDFWATEEGWEHKKKSKTKVINWKSTLIKTIDQKFNQLEK